MENMIQYLDMMDKTTTEKIDERTRSKVLEKVSHPDPSDCIEAGVCAECRFDHAR